MNNKWEIKELDEIAELIKDKISPKTLDCAYIGLEHIEKETLHLNNIGHSFEVDSLKYCFNENDILFGQLNPSFRKVIKPSFN
jgi:type I restriction enzyme S subunit